MTPLQRLFDGDLPRLVMFDLDGTLLDSVPDLSAAIDHMLVAMGREAVGVERVRDWVGNGAEMLVRRALSGRLQAGAEDEPVLQQAMTLFMAAYAEQHSLTRVYPGVMECLAGLRQLGLPLAVVTNKPMRFVGPLLEAQGLGEFDWIVGGDSLPTRKPDPAGLQWVIQQAGVSAQQALFVGDSRNDVLAARAAGVRCVALGYGYNHGRPIALEHPDLLLDNLADLLCEGTDS